MRHIFSSFVSNPDKCINFFMSITGDKSFWGDTDKSGADFGSEDGIYDCILFFDCVFEFLVVFGGGGLGDGIGVLFAWWWAGDMVIA